MKWTTSCASAASNESSANGSCLRRSLLDPDARMPLACGRDERLRGVDCGHLVGAEQPHELGRQRARAAADVQHALARATPAKAASWGASSTE